MALLTGSHPKKVRFADGVLHFSSVPLGFSLLLHLFSVNKSWAYDILEWPITTMAIYVSIISISCGTWQGISRNISYLIFANLTLENSTNRYPATNIDPKHCTARKTTGSCWPCSQPRCLATLWSAFCQEPGLRILSSDKLMSWKAFRWSTSIYGLIERSLALRSIYFWDIPFTLGILMVFVVLRKIIGKLWVWKHQGRYSWGQGVEF